VAPVFFLAFSVLILLGEAGPPVYNSTVVYSLTTPWIRQDFLVAQVIGSGTSKVSNLTLRNNGSDAPLYIVAFQTNYATLDTSGNVVRELLETSNTISTSQTTLPDGNVVNSLSFSGDIVVCSSYSITFEIFKNAENVPYAGTFIPISEGGWKMSFEIFNCSFEATEAVLSVSTEIFLGDLASNYTLSFDSRGSMYRISWFYADPTQGIMRRWNWNWPQIAIIDGNIMPIFVNFTTNDTSGVSYITWTVPSFSYALYDPDIGVVLELNNNDVSDGSTTKIVVAVVVPVAVGLALLITLIVAGVGFGTMVFVAYRRRRMMNTRLATIKNVGL